MRTLIISFIIYLFNASGSDINGVWLNPEGHRSIRIFEQKGKYFGVMHWIGEPEEQLKAGQLILKNLEFRDGQFVNGLAFTPGYGWVHCHAVVAGGKLHLTGHKFGVSRTRVFQKAR